MRQAVPQPFSKWPSNRLVTTARHYVRRTWRWWRVLREYRPGTVRPRGGRRRVLIVRLDAIGDFVLWSGAAQVLREWLGPDVHVTLAANATWADLARDADIADEVWPVRRESLEWNGAYRSWMHARIAGGRFDLAINPRLTREMVFGDSIVRWSRAAERIGWHGEGHLLPERERRWADRWYTKLIQQSAEDIHETERNLEFLRALGAPTSTVPPPRLQVYLRPTHGLEELDGKYFVVFPGASLPEKRWDPAHFAAVARHVQAKTGWRPVLLGEQADAPTTAAVAADVPGALDLAGQTSVAVLASAIQGSRLVISNDTSAVHLAAATGVRAICIVGGWQWRRFVPYPATLGEMARRVEVVSMESDMKCFNCNWHCIYPHVAGDVIPCVARVPLERALEAVDRALAASGADEIGRAHV